MFTIKFLMSKEYIKLIQNQSMQNRNSNVLKMPLHCFKVHNFVIELI